LAGSSEKIAFRRPLATSLWESKNDPFSFASFTVNQSVRATAVNGVASIGHTREEIILMRIMYFNFDRQGNHVSQQLKTMRLFLATSSTWFVSTRVALRFGSSVWQGTYVMTRLACRNYTTILTITCLHLSFWCASFWHEESASISDKWIWTRACNIWSIGRLYNVQLE